MKPRHQLSTLIAAEIVSVLGSKVTLIAIPWLVLLGTGSAIDMGIAGAVEMVPYMVTSVFAAPLADRFGLRRTSVVADVGSALAMALVAAFSGMSYLGLLVVIAIAGGLRGIGDRVKHVMIRPVAEAAGLKLIRVTSAHDGLTRTATLLGAPLGGLLVLWLSARGAIWFDAVTFALCAVAVGVFVTQQVPAPPVGEPYLKALKGGFDFVRHDGVLLAMWGTIFVLNMFSNASIVVFTPLWISDVLHSPAALGLVLGAFSAGALLGNIAFTAWGPRLPQLTVFFIGAAVSGAPRLLALALSDQLSVVMLVSFCSGVGIAAVNPILGVALYERVPTALQTRVIGISGAVSFAGLPLGALLGGIVVQAFGLTDALLTAAIICALVTTVPLVWLHRGLSRQETPTGAAPAAPVLPALRAWLAHALPVLRARAARALPALRAWASQALPALRGWASRPLPALRAWVARTLPALRARATRALASARRTAAGAPLGRATSPTRPASRSARPSAAPGRTQAGREIGVGNAIDDKATEALGRSNVDAGRGGDAGGGGGGGGGGAGKKAPPASRKKQARRNRSASARNRRNHAGSSQHH